MFRDAKEQYWQSQRRLRELERIVEDVSTRFLAYTVKRNVARGRYNPYVYFTYGMGIFNGQTRQFHRLGSSAILNNNTMIKELSKAYKTDMESALGGWNMRR